MTLAASARQAARSHPFLYDALREGVVNYTAAATYLDLDGDTDAVATALRRYAEDLPPLEEPTGSARVRMERDGTPDTLPSPEDGETAIVAEGDVDTRSLAAALDRLRIEDVDVAAAGGTDGRFAVVVDRRAGATAVRCVEGTLDR